MEVFNLKEAASKIVVSGHRGGKLAYENTMTGFKLAIDHGIPQIEFDVWLTRDKIPIVIHGSEEGTIGFENESTGVTKESKITELTLEQIKSLDLPENEEVPTLEELLDLCAGKIHLNVEIKDPNIEICQIVMDMLKDRGYTGETVCFSSFKHHILKELKNIDPSFPCGYLYEYDEAMDVAYYPEHGDSVNIPYSHLTQELVDNCNRKGKKIAVYFPGKFPEDPSNYQKVLEMGVHTFISDKPLEFMAYLKSLDSLQ